MMDPLSITVAVVGLGTLSATCVKEARAVVRAFGNAPYEILSLSNEVNDFYLCFSQLERSIPTPEALSSHNTHVRNHEIELLRAIEPQISRAKGVLKNFDQLVKKLVVVGPHGWPKVQRHVWIRKKGEVKVLKDQFTEIKNSLCLLFAASSASRTARIELALQVPKAITDTQYLINISQEGEAEKGEECSASDPQQNPITLLAPPSQRRGSSPDLEKGNHVEDPTSAKMEIISSASERVGAGALPWWEQQQLQSFSATTFHAFKYQECTGACDCACHHQLRYRSPRFMNQFIGALHVGYRGLPMLRSECDEPNCSNVIKRSVWVSYTFPQWFMARTMELMATVLMTGDPIFSLRVMRRIDFSAEHSIFHLAQNGRTIAIRKLFEERLASPMDIDLSDGSSAFHWALTGEHIDTCQFLVQAGSNLDHVNDFGVTTAHEVSESILLYAPTSDFARALAVMFSFIDHSELWGLDHLHRVVLGILPLNLEAVLEGKVDVNCADTRGRTPAHWAGLRGDADSLQSLLLHGADLTIQDYEGSTILHGAIKSGSVQCVELLLRAKCDPNVRDQRGFNSIHLAARVTNDVKLFDLLLRAGGSLHNRSKDKSTPLQTAACHNRWIIGKMMIQEGADVDADDRHGDNIIFEAIYCHHVEFLEMLLQYRLDLSHKNARGRTVFHVVALFADLRTLETLNTHIFRLPVSLSGEAFDSKGRTPIECFESRSDLSEELKEAFEALLAKIGGSEASSLNDVYVDAFEDYEEKPVSVD